MVYPGYSLEHNLEQRLHGLVIFGAEMTPACGGVKLHAAQRLYEQFAVGITFGLA